MRTFSLGAGADSITGGEGADTIIGGSGNDTIVLTESSAVSDTVVFASTVAANGVDTITGFEAGSSADVLNVSAFLITTSAAKTATSLGTDGSGVEIKTSGIDASENVIFVKDVATLNYSNFSTSAKSANVIKIANDTKYVVIAKDTSVDNIYYVEASSGTITVTSVGTVASSSGAITAFDGTNFA